MGQSGYLWGMEGLPWYGMPLSKHATHNKVNAGGLLGEGEEWKPTLEWGQERGRQVGVGKKEETREKSERNERKEIR